MLTAKKGQAHVAARARLMLLLGEQLITDEVAAVSELVKNAYDADATRVVVTLSHVSEPETGQICIKDNGHGMTLEKVLSSWLELGTLSKARGVDKKPRQSELKNRTCLGEKGLGRLAVHKLGRFTELVTRRVETNLETRLILDWTAFERAEGFLDEVPVEWQQTEISVFVKDPDFENGTQITIKKLQRRWTREMIIRVQRGLLAMKSPFTELSDFDVAIDVDDPLAPEVSPPNMSELVAGATYTFIVDIDENGQIKGRYKVQRPDLPELSREIVIRRDIREPGHFRDDRKPVCGPFRVRFYSWDLTMKDQRAVFGDTATYKEMIAPNTGVKVFRDGFRVLPYGNEDNDWLSMDLERVRRFEQNLSRNQIIGEVAISAHTNPDLLDKSGREGLIDNDAFRDFISLVKSALNSFEAYRLPDRQKIKDATGLTRDQSEGAVFSRTMALLMKAIAEQPRLDAETRLQISKLASDARDAMNSVLAEREQRLLVASTIGLTYMMPTHEVRRDMHEALKILRRMRDPKQLSQSGIDTVISLLKQADSTVGGLGRLMQRTEDVEPFQLEKSAKVAIELLHHRFERNSIDCQLIVRSSRKIVGSDRLVTILLLNLLDNSIYWLLRKKPDEREIKIIVDSRDEKAILAVSDSGPGFGEDDIQTLTLPFFTRKPNGMGLGLYIADRIAGMNGGKLKLLGENELPELLPGGNIAVLFSKSTS